MDIDEFLDRELSDLGSDSEEERIMEPKSKEADEQSPLIESIKSSLGKGSIFTIILPRKGPVSAKGRSEKI